jgi:hypothetical protein
LSVPIIESIYLFKIYVDVESVLPLLQTRRCDARLTEVILPDLDKAHLRT